MQPSRDTRPDGQIHVAITNGDNISGELLAAALKRGPEPFDGVSLVCKAHHAMQTLESLKPDVVLIGDSPDIGLALLRELRHSSLKTSPIMLLDSVDIKLVVEAFRSGARGIFYRDRTFRALQKCIRVVYSGQIWASNDDIEHLIGAISQLREITFDKADAQSLLTQREEEVVRLVVDGMKNRDIARTLHLTEHSVRNYLYRVFEKVKVSSRVELILYAFSRTKTYGNTLPTPHKTDMPIPPLRL